MRDFLRRWLVPYLPYPHFMGLAPLDVMARLLFLPPASIPLQYWPRLATILAVSALVTVAALPERLALALWLKVWPPPIDKHNAPILVLGYFRSGTTFLQSLLAADPRMRSPRWAATLAPHGFVLVWTFLRFFLVPFFPLTRMARVTPIEPSTPGEDDFALNNWTLASILAGRAVLPQAQRFYGRFNDLDALTPAELSRWQRTQLAFVRKLLLASPGRRLVLKSPSHTARVDHLLALFPGAKFVHISRPPMTVFRSNLLLVRALQSSFRLQDPLSEAEQQQIILDEYIATEEKYLATKKIIPRGDLAEVRLQDLIADPIGEIERVYRELDLPMSEEFQANIRALLADKGDHTAAAHPNLPEEQKRRITARLGPLVTALAHDRPAIATVEPAAASLKADDRPRHRIAALAGLATALLCLAAWVGFTNLVGDRHDWLVWPTGLAIGFATLQVARSGSSRLGLWAVLLTAATFLTAAFLNTWSFGHGGQATVPLAVVIARTFQELQTGAMLFWTAMGLVTAYRIGSGTRP